MGCGREDHEELDRFLNEATETLERGDLHGAQEALKRAGLKAAAMWDEVGRPPGLSGPTREVIRLVGEMRECLDYPERAVPPGLERLEEVRCRFELEAREETAEITADEPAPWARWDRTARIGLPEGPSSEQPYREER